MVVVGGGDGVGNGNDGVAVDGEVDERSRAVDPSPFLVF